jgi:hypothetical protein
MENVVFFVARNHRSYYYRKEREYVLSYSNKTKLCFFGNFELHTFFDVLL